MARLMTLSLPWRHKDYTVLVTLKSSSEDVHYTIVFDQADLLEFIPEGELKFYGSEGAYLLDKYTTSEAREIINRIISELLVKYS